MTDRTENQLHAQDEPDVIWGRTPGPDPEPEVTTGRDWAAWAEKRLHRPPVSDTVIGAWIAAIAAFAAVVVLARFAGPPALHAAGRTLAWLNNPGHTVFPAGRLWHTVADPVHVYLQTHGQGLPAGPRTLLMTWALSGLVILVLAMRRGADVGVQIGAVTYGALTAAMVWAGTPAPGRTVATGLTLLLWAVLAALALTGSWITTHTTVLPTPPAPLTVPVHITVPETRPTRTDDHQEQ